MFSRERRGQDIRERQNLSNNTLFSRHGYHNTPNQPTNPVTNLMKRFTKTGNVSSFTNKTFGDLNKTLYNVREVAKVVQSATPIVQEYGPIVKNLPAMYRMMKAINQVDAVSSDEVTETKEQKKSSKTDYSSPDVTSLKEEDNKYPRLSQPKIFF